MKRGVKLEKTDSSGRQKKMSVRLLGCEGQKEQFGKKL